MKREKIELTHPITVSGAEVKILQIRRPKVRDMLGVEKALIMMRKRKSVYLPICVK